MVKFLAVASSGENPSDAGALAEVSRPEEHASLSETQAHTDKLCHFLETQAGTSHYFTVTDGTETSVEQQRAPSWRQRSLTFFSHDMTEGLLTIPSVG